MENFTIREVGGLTVCFERLPSITRPVYMALVMFVGSKDDESVGEHGLYHWFEHVPFRGTESYPNGESDFSDYKKSGGLVGARTGVERTEFWAFCPKSSWATGLSIITDLVSNPLIRSADVEAERRIIADERLRKNANSEGTFWHEAFRVLWDGHPIGHPVLGSAESLESMGVEALRSAHQQGYDRSRCMLFVSGDIDQNDLLRHVERVAEQLPNHGLSARDRPCRGADLPAWKTGKTTIGKHLPDSQVSMLFPLAAFDESDHGFACEMLQWMFRGDQSSLYRTVRHDRQLSYATRAQHFMCREGGFLRMHASTKRSNISALEDAFCDALTSSELSSRDWFEYVRATLSGRFHLQLTDPRRSVNAAIRMQSARGEVMSEAEEIAQHLAVKHETVRDLLREITPRNARTVVLRGEG